MDKEPTEEREAAATAREVSRTGRCGWIGLGLVLLLIPGIFPGSFIGGLVCLNNFQELAGHRLGDSLSGRVMVIAGMAGGLLLASVVLLFLTLAVRGIAGRLVRWYRANSEPSV